MRPVDKALFQGNRVSYNPYGKAKDHLIEALGDFCSYCERQGMRSALAVEHIQDKNTYPQNEYDWVNLLLSCVNCNSIKARKDITAALLPDRDNTFNAFTYLEGGLVQVNSGATAGVKLKAKALIDLVGLDRRPNRNGYSGSDDLWLKRKENWELAQRYLIKYQNNECDIETIKDLALSRGFWSVWMQLFSEFPEVQKELIHSFSGTQKAFFQQRLNHE